MVLTEGAEFIGSKPYQGKPPCASQVCEKRQVPGTLGENHVTVVTKASPAEDA